MKLIRSYIRRHIGIPVLHGQCASEAGICPAEAGRKGSPERTDGVEMTSLGYRKKPLRGDHVPDVHPSQRDTKDQSVIQLGIIGGIMLHILSMLPAVV